MESLALILTSLSTNSRAREMALSSVRWVWKLSVNSRCRYLGRILVILDGSRTSKMDSSRIRASYISWLSDAMAPKTAATISVTCALRILMVFSRTCGFPHRDASPMTFPKSCPSREIKSKCLVKISRASLWPPLMANFRAESIFDLMKNDSGNQRGLARINLTKGARSRPL